MMKLPLSGINFNNQAAVEAKRTSMQEELRTLLDTWEHENENNDWDVNPILKRIAEILEEAINDFMQQNPDPMDDRHPLKSQPLRPLGHLLKMITRIDSFVNRLVISYLLARDNTERNVLAARLMLNLLPGIDTNVVLADADSLLTKLYQWAEHSDSRELRAYSMALLGAAMGAEQAHQYRQNNIALIPIALQRLRELYAQMIEDYKKANEEQDMARKHTVGPTNFAQLRQEEEKRQEAHAREEQRQAHAELIRDDKIETTPIRKRHSEANGLSPPPKRSVSLSCMPQGTVSAMVSPSIDSVIRNAGSPFREAWNIINGSAEAGSSNSSWRQTMQPILIGTHCLYPLSIEMEQRLILHYLGPTSEYQDNVSILLEHHALDVVLNYLAMEVDGHSHICRDIRLLFDAIRYISSLLIHRKFAWEFVAAQGIQRLLRINRQSLALTAVATCLYYLAYSTDIMEKVCHLPDPVLSEMMDYGLYALDHSHESGRASIAMFLAYALHFRTILDRFDQRDGLRRLYNYISTLTILQKNNEDNEEEINDDHYTQSVATIKNAILALKCYLQSHIFLKIEHMKRTQMGRHHNQQNQQQLPTIPHTIPSQAHPHFKPMLLDDETERACAEYLIQSQCMLQPHNHNWKPIEDMRNLGIFQMAFRMISNYPEWLNYERQGKAETLKLALEVLRLATISPKVQLDACETILIRKAPTQGLSMLLEIADGDITNDPQVQRAALEVLLNCLYSPTERGTNHTLGLHYRFGKGFDRDILPKELGAKFASIWHPEFSIAEKAVTPLASTSVAKTIATTTFPAGMDGKDKGLRLFLSPEQIQQILWKCAQQNNAIMILTALVHKKEPPTEADMLRELACRALNGIARFEPVRQILSKLPIIAANELNALMQTPVLIEKRVEHSRFCEQARQLIERVSQIVRVCRSDFPIMEMTQENLWRAAVVAQTMVKFNEKELLQLIYQHLMDINFKRTAKQLVAEADLPNIPASRIPSTPASLPGFPHRNASSFANIIARRALKFNRDGGTTSQSINTTASYPSQASTSTATHQGNRLPIKLLSTPVHSSNDSTLLPVSSFTPFNATSRSTTANNATFSLKVRPHKSLGDIVQSYFRNEHAICRNPVANCPPFSLFYPHRCPEPKLLYSAPTNFVNRLQCRLAPPYRCTQETLRQADRRLVFSRFRHHKTFSEDSEIFTCCKFTQNDEHVFLGTFSGDMYVYNVRTGSVDSTYNCHHSAISAIRPAKDRLMLTSSSFVMPYSVLWKMEENGITVADRLIDFKEDQYAEFGNLSIYQIVGTQGPKAIVYDTETAKPVVSLFDERLANHYTRNRAYFDPLDELVLNDGILFDPRIGQHGRVVYKFDKMNLDVSGVFHPRGTEVIINREVWDLRTHRLLHTVPALDQCQVSFNSTGSILSGIVHQDPVDVDDRFYTMFNNYFRTFDSANYEVISTHDTRKPLLDLCFGNSDNFVGVVEIGRSSHDDTNFFKLFEIGRRRDMDDEDEDDGEQDEQNQDEDDEEAEGFSSSDSDESIHGASGENNEADNSDADTVHSERSSINSSEELFMVDGPSNDEEIAQEEDEEEAMMEEEEGQEGGTDDDDSSYSDEDFELSSDDFSP